MIIALINTGVRNRNHKFGIKIPTNAKEAIELDRVNNNTAWQDALAKEMYKVGMAFKILHENESLPVGYKRSSGHIIFDVKMDFTWKVRWVKDGHQTPDLDDNKYAGLVLRESVRITLTYAVLHQTDVLAADIRNAYLRDPTSEKHYIVCGK